MFFLIFNQVKVAFDLNKTLKEGQDAMAEVTRYNRVDRQDVTHGEVSLRIPMPDGSVLVREKMALPYSLSYAVEKESLAVRVAPGAAQEIVITEIGATQVRIAAINAGMSLIGFLVFGTGLFAWNRYLKQKGDPALATPEED